MRSNKLRIDTDKCIKQPPHRTSIPFVLPRLTLFIISNFKSEPLALPLRVLSFSTMASTPMKTPSSKSQPSAAATSMLRRAPPPAMDSISSSSGNTSSDSTKSRFEAYNRLQAAAVAFGEKLPIPEIVAIGGQSDGKSSLLEALLGFRFNVREVEMGTRRPLVLQMVHDLTALEPRCRFQVDKLTIVISFLFSSF